MRIEVVQFEVQVARSQVRAKVGEEKVEVVKRKRVDNVVWWSRWFANQSVGEKECLKHRRTTLGSDSRHG